MLPIVITKVALVVKRQPELVTPENNRSLLHANMEVYPAISVLPENDKMTDAPSFERTAEISDGAGTGTPAGIELSIKYAGIANSGHELGEVGVTDTLYVPALVATI